MHISLIQAVLIAIFYYLSWSPWLTYVGFFTWNRPLLAGFVTGIILGDPVQGAIIGAGINMIYLGFISAGGAQMGDPAFAGYVGTALAIASKLDVSTAMAIAVPLVQKGNVDRVAFINIVPPQILLFAMSFIPALLVVYFGPNAIDGMLEVMNDNVLHVFNVIGAMLPALGIAMNLKLIGNKFTMPFFILGILMAVYFKVDIIVISVIGVILALTITSIKYGKDSATS